MSFNNSNNYSKNRKSNFSDKPPPQANPKPIQNHYYQNSFPNYGSAPPNFQPKVQPVYVQYSKSPINEIPRYEIPNYGSTPREKPIDTGREVRVNPQPMPTYTYIPPQKIDIEYKKQETQVPPRQVMDIEYSSNKIKPSYLDNNIHYAPPSYKPPLPEKKSLSTTQESHQPELRKSVSKPTRSETIEEPEVSPELIVFIFRKRKQLMSCRLKSMANTKS
jgi:hypothetical protein